MDLSTIRLGEAGSKMDATTVTALLDADLKTDKVTTAVVV